MRGSISSSRYGVMIIKSASSHTAVRSLLTALGLHCCHLQKLKADNRPTSKAREVYNEVDTIDSELKHAIAENEESKIKANRLYVLVSHEA